MDFGLMGKSGIVVGASRGIGKAIALELSREGVDLAVVSRSYDDLAATAAEISGETGHRVVPIAADVTDRERVEEMVEQAAREFGGLNILII